MTDLSKNFQRIFATPTQGATRLGMASAPEKMAEPKVDLTDLVDFEQRLLAYTHASLSKIDDETMKEMQALREKLLKSMGIPKRMIGVSETVKDLTISGENAQGFGWCSIR